MRRVLVLSHTYLQPAHRGKLKALAARGLEVTVAIPQRWREPWFGRPIDVAWERQGGLEVFPLPARGTTKYSGSALKALPRDRRPDLAQIEDEPASPAARQVCGAPRRPGLVQMRQEPARPAARQVGGAARRLGIPVVLYTQQNVEQEQGWLGRWKQRRMLRKLHGVIAGSDLTCTLVRKDAPELPIAVIPQLGALAPHEPQHVPHEGLALGFVGRLVAQKGVDNLLQALGSARLRGAKWRLTIVGDGPERLQQV